MLSDETIHKCYLYIKDPFIPRYLDTGRQTARETLRQFFEWGEAFCDNPEHQLPLLKKRHCIECWAELKKQEWGIER